MINIMKTILLISCAFLMIACSSSPDFLGHWKCDTTGTATTNYNGNIDTKPITDVYNGLNIFPFEFEFLANGTIIQHNRKSKTGFTNETYNYSTNYLGDPNKIMIANEVAGNIIFTIKSTTAETMSINLLMIEDETSFDLVLNKL